MFFEHWDHLLHETPKELLQSSLAIHRAAHSVVEVAAAILYKRHHKRCAGRLRSQQQHHMRQQSRAEIKYFFVHTTRPKLCLIYVANHDSNYYILSMTLCMLSRASSIIIDKGLLDCRLDNNSVRLPASWATPPSLCVEDGDDRSVRK